MSKITNNNNSRDEHGRADATLIATHEESDVSIPGLAKSGVALVALGIVANLLVWGMFNYLNTSADRSQPPPPPMFKGNQLPPEPRLQGAPGHESSALDDMLEMRAREDSILGSYGWVDQQSGVVHIPIEVAKKLILERGMVGGLEETPQKPLEPGK